MHSAQPEINSVELNKISFAVEHRLAWFGYLKLCIANNIRCQPMPAILTALYAEQRLPDITYPLQCEPKLSITQTINGFRIAKSWKHIDEAFRSVVDKFKAPVFN